jgi:N-formylglutamate amidohydrolase
MEEHNIFDRLGRVGAPQGFEGRVLDELSRRKKRRAHARLIYRYAFAGGAAVLLATFVLVNVLVVRQPGDVSVAGKRTASGPVSSEAVQVMETMDYSTEVHNASYEPRTVYILEQVSEASPQEITY